jgi:3-oxoacyl-[acyl-carrier protein] reductase
MRNVLVTGGSRGLGMAISRKLARTGLSVIAVARAPNEAFEECAAELNAEGIGALQFRRFDLNDVDGIPAFAAALSEEFGLLYGLVNNAAIGTSGILATMHDSRIEALVRLNVVSPITLTKYAVRSMMVGGCGRIVNISSIVGSTGYSGLSAYSASKAALIGFTRSLARELGPLGITVNNVSPGFLDTDMTRGLGASHVDQIVRRSALRRLPDLEDVAGAVEYLFSDNARSVTGIAMTVDAGNTT